MVVYTVGHGRRPADELIEVLRAAGARTLVDVRRFPGSRRNPQFNQRALAAALEDAGIEYRHAVELGGLRSDEPGEERFPCVRVPGFRSYAARIALPEWQEALAEMLGAPAPSLMCAETLPDRCHRRLISDFLAAHGHEVVHLIRPDEARPHRLSPGSEAHGGKLYICGELVA